MRSTLGLKQELLSALRVALSNAVPGSSGKRDTRRGMAVTRPKRRVCRGQSWEIVREMEVSIRKSSVNGGFHGKIHCKRRFSLGKSWEIVGKIWENPWVLKGKINYTYISLFEEFEHCLKKYLLHSISPIVGWCSSGTFSRHLPIFGLAGFNQWLSSREFWETFLDLLGSNGVLRRKRWDRIM